MADKKNITRLPGAEQILKEIHREIGKDKPIKGKVVHASSAVSLPTIPPAGSLTKEPQDYMKVGIHILTQLYNNPRQTEIFSQDKINEFIMETGGDSNNPPKMYGAELTVIQSMILEGIAKALTETNYKGTYQKMPWEKISDLDIRGSNIIKKQYEYIEAIPVIKITQAELIRQSGLDPRKQSHKQHAQQALNFLATERFCFYWKRAVKDSRGKIETDKAGKWKKEDVMEVGTFLRVKYVKKSDTDKLDYYEIEPSPVMLDQVDNYFIMIPYTWREEVEQIMGKNVSKYTYFFLQWLRLQFELIRRKNSSLYQIRITWEELAVTLKMPESLYMAKKKTAINILETAYNTAKELGYLNRVEKTGAVHIFHLNENYYHRPARLKS